MHYPYQPGQRPATAGGPADPSRQQYLPPPPPPPSAPPNPQTHGIPLPPPPPRLQQGPSQSQLLPRTPTVNPSNPYSWQSPWSTRQAGLPPPPPPPPQAQLAAYNPNAYYSYQSNAQAYPPPPPENQPLVSATYIPYAGSSLGLDNIDISGFSDGPASPPPGQADRQPEPGNAWPMDRVLDWLKAHGFSDDWRNTFKKFDVQGSHFLNIGKGHTGNLGMIHEVFIPELSKQSKEAGTTWDANQAKAEARRLRRLVRNIVENGGIFDPGPRESESGRPRESSLSAHTPGPGDESPGFSAGPASRARSTSTQGRSPNIRNTPFSPIEEAPPMEKSRSAYTEATLRSVADGKRHSPNGSTENGTGTSASPNPAPYGTNRFYGHKRGPSSESSLNGGANGGLAPRHSISAGAGSRNAQDRRRPSIAESINNGAADASQSAKEHRGLLDRLKRRQKKDETPTTFDDILSSVPSPSSPSSHRHFFSNPPYLKTTANASDTALDKPMAQNSERRGTVASHSRLNSKTDGKQYIMLTPDGWNYRLVDVSACETAETFRDLVRYNLQIPHSNDLPIYMTSPGQKEHTEALLDAQIVQCLHGADPSATLKLFIRAHSLVGNAADVAIGSGPVRSAPPNKSPYANAPPNSLDQPTYDRLIGDAPGRDGLHFDAPAKPSEPGKPFQSDESKRQDEDARPKNRQELEVAAEEHRQLVLQKQRLYHDRRRSRLNRESEGAPLHRDGVIDFDEPRVSPFNDKKESLVPLRHPPPAPPNSNTLLKANSLSKRSPGSMQRTRSERTEGHQLRRSWDNQEPSGPNHKRSRHGEETVSASAAPRLSLHPRPSDADSEDMMTAVTNVKAEEDMLKEQQVAPKQSTGGSPRSPGFINSKGNVPFRIPEYDDSSSPQTSPEKQKGKAKAVEQPFPPVQRLNIARKEDSTRSRSISPSQPPTRPPLGPRRSTRQSTGPNFDFKEHHVDFSRTSDADDSNDSSDGSSDEDIFAKPLKNRTKPGEHAPASGLDSQSSTLTNNPRERPPLHVVTSRDNRKVDSFESSGTARPLPSPESHQTTPTARPESSPAPEHGALFSPESPDGRPISFISDAWADRPAPEKVAENLDDFFPNVDLDQPMLPVESPPTSPNTRKEPSSATRSIQDDVTSAYPISSTSESDDTDGDMVKPMTAAMRFRRAGGLGRTKSIRDVVKSVYQQPTTSRHNTIHPASRVANLKQQESTNIMRRKSTKMFGAKIEQIKPRRGSRLLSLETIPQDHPMPQQDNISTAPRRQATFKWVRGQLIGTGTFGRVFLGMNTTTGELMAVKQVEVNMRNLGGDKDKIKEMVKSLDQEIDTMQNLEHNNIVQYLGCERKEYSISIFLEYIAGGSVGSCLRKHGKFEEPVVSSLTRQTLNGLAYLHHSGILHRDLKADNVLLDTDGTCKISDFGISKKTDNIYGNDAQNTMQGSVFWMAPEVVRSQGSGYSAKVDIWSLGCVVLEMFAGRRPWSKEEAVGAIYKLGSLGLAPPIPDDVSSQISPAALSFMYDCFTVDPVDRPTADTLLNSPFAWPNPHYSFFDSELYQKIKPLG